VLGGDAAAASKVMTSAMGSYGDVSAAAHLPVTIAADVAETVSAGSAVTALRLEGVTPSVAQRKSLLESLLAPFGALASLDEALSRALWRAIRDVAPFAAKGRMGGADIWRISTAPARGAEIGRALADKAGAEILYDWAGGLVWAALPRSDDAQAPLVHAAVAAAGGHATLIRAPTAVRAKVDVFAPEPAPLAALTQRVRKGFDPHGVLNPGRMWAGV
jgi:glycolate oxidase FAD binding subunit